MTEQDSSSVNVSQKTERNSYALRNRGRLKEEKESQREKKKKRFTPSLVRDYSYIDGKIRAIDKERNIYRESY